MGGRYSRGTNATNAPKTQQERISRIELLIGIAESKRLGPTKAKELLELVREAITTERAETVARIIAARSHRSDIII